MPPLRLILALSAAAALAGCSGSSKPAESPDAPAASSDPDAKSDSKGDAKSDAPAEPKGDDAPSKPRQDDSVPDDYSITAGDCEALGQQYGTAARNDQLATLSPKLSDKQKAAAQASIDKVVNRMADQWTDHCKSALVGMVADPKSLKCAVAAPTVKAFDVCLNGDNATVGKPGKKK